VKASALLLISSHTDNFYLAVYYVTVLYILHKYFCHNFEVTYYLLVLTTEVNSLKSEQTILKHYNCRDKIT